MKNFSKEIKGLTPKQFVDSPWTAKEIVVGPRAYTSDIFDCTAGGITDGEKVVMFHFGPMAEANQDFSEIEKSILEKLGGKTEGLRGFLLGSKCLYKDSKALFKNLKSFMERHNIPCSFARGDTHMAHTSIAYDAKKDTWTVSNEYITEQLPNKKIDLLKILSNSFEEVQIAKGDCLVKSSN